MKKNILWYLVLILLNSCAIPSYKFQTGQTTGVDFSSGKWLLNRIDAPYNANEKIEKLAIKDFTKKLNNRLSYAPAIKGLLLPSKIGPEPSTSELSKLKKITQFDYFINIKATILKDEVGKREISKNHRGSSLSNDIEVYVEIYDLNLSQIIYAQKVVGGTSMNEKDTEDIHFWKSCNELIVRGYKKIMKDINKKSKK